MQANDIRHHPKKKIGLLTFTLAVCLLGGLPTNVSGLSVSDSTWSWDSGTYDGSNINIGHGASGTSTVNINGGTANFTGELSMGTLSGSGAHAYLNASGGEVNIATSTTLHKTENVVGDSKGRGAATLNFSGADVTVRGPLLFGDTSNTSYVPGPLTVNLSDGSFTINGYKRSLRLGANSSYPSAVTMDINQTGGDANYNDEIYIGFSNNVHATYTISGGTFDAQANISNYRGLWVGVDGGSTGSGTFHVDGAGADHINIQEQTNIRGSGTLRMTIDSTGSVTPISTGAISVTGTVDLELDGYTPMQDQVFDLMSGGSLDYSSASLAADDVGIWDLGDDGSGTLQAIYLVPEPAAVSLLLAAGTLLLTRRRHV